MKRLIPVAALAAVALLAAAILSASGSAQQTGARTFTLIEKENEGTFHFVNLPPRGKAIFRGGPVSAGDLFVFHQPLRTSAGRRAGAADVNCTATGGGKGFTKAQFACHGVYGLKNGDLAVEAAFHGQNVVTIAVTGGTGVFEGAQGSIKSNNRTHKDTVHLLG